MGFCISNQLIWIRPTVLRLVTKAISKTSAFRHSSSTEYCRSAEQQTISSPYFPRQIRPGPKTECPEYAKVFSQTSSMHRRSI